MKSKVAIMLLVIVSIGLAVALFTRQKKAELDRKELEAQLTQQSNLLKQTSGKLEEQQQVNISLESTLKSRAAEMSTLSNNLNKLIGELEKSDAQAKATAEQLRNAQSELTKRDQKITDLEGERSNLGKQMDQLTNSISDLSKQITATQQKLARAEGDRAWLTRELKRMQAEKAELERQFNDIAVLRAQVSKLKEELAISRRLEFIRLSLFGTAKGGAEKLMPHVDKNPARVASASASRSNYSLNVEVRQDSGARVVAPTNAAPPPASSPVTPPAARPPATTNATVPAVPNAGAPAPPK